ncbi:histidine phosphatase family protein [Pararhodonellum marinum]|uniref:histidine phosphatase family protein n=1 Tax=Pararhodonellum marinum TaxID=2755358 RepID=UPI00188E2EA8|nr:histidine phosphatase family protein [Pararhodonellum marinum]
MIRKKIYVVRHGQTDYNKMGVVQGSGIDAPINELGKQQANAFFEAYQDIQIEKVFFTGLQRTRQSIIRFIEEKGLPFEAVPEFNEISWGIYEGVPMTDEENAYYQHMLKRWSAGELNYAIEGGESPVMVADRLKRGMEKVLAGEEKTILICMHGRAMRILLSVLLNYNLKYMDNFIHENLGCYELSLMSDGSYRLDVFNNTDHLKALHSL